MSKLLAVLYHDPENYPPTLNAIDELANDFDQIDVLFRSHWPAGWRYPSTVKLHQSGETMSVEQQQTAPLWKRYALVSSFALELARLIRRERPDVLVLYDPLALLAYALVRALVRRPKTIWYHNHDVLELANVRPMSLAWLASRAERALFSDLDMFSLPAVERWTAFSRERFKGRFFFLPNWPRASRSAGKRQPQAGPTLRLLYQGRVTRGHGIDEVLELLPFSVQGKAVELVLAGWFEPAYRERIERFCRERGTEELVTMASYMPYQDLAGFTASCDVGIAVHMGTDVMNKTLGTASNKIYEYAAAGLPIIYFDNEHFREHLGGFTWAFAWDGRTETLPGVLSQILSAYEAASTSARSAHVEHLNFGAHFRDARAFLRERLGAPLGRP